MFALLVTPLIAGSPAQAADWPGSCTTSYSGPLGVATCTGVAPATKWQAIDVCALFIPGVLLPYEYWAGGNTVTGNGTSTVVCGIGEYAENHVRAVILADGRVHTPIVGWGGKCVDVAGASAQNANAIQLYDCNNTTAQDWALASDGTLRSLGKCLNVQQGNTANGTKVELYDCRAGWDSEQWQYRTDGSLMNTQSGRCLDAPDNTTANKTRLQIWDCNGNANQHWTMTV